MDGWSSADWTSRELIILTFWGLELEPAGVSLMSSVEFCRRPKFLKLSVFPTFLVGKTLKNMLREEKGIRWASTSEGCCASTLQIKEVIRGRKHLLVSGWSFSIILVEMCFIAGRADFSPTGRRDGWMQSFSLWRTDHLLFCVSFLNVRQVSCGAGEASSDDPKLTGVAGACWLPANSGNKQIWSTITWEAKYGFHNNRAKLGASMLARPKRNAS